MRAWNRTYFAHNVLDLPAYYFGTSVARFLDLDKSVDGVD
jgi:hypothetical protein